MAHIDGNRYLWLPDGYLRTECDKPPCAEQVAVMILTLKAGSLSLKTSLFHACLAVT
jgi:hypothetical protein